MTDSPAAHRYRDALVQAVREAATRPAQKEFLRNRCKADAGIMWHLFASYFDDRVSADLGAAAQRIQSKNRSKQGIVAEEMVGNGTYGGRYPSARGTRFKPNDLSDVVDLGVRSMKLWQFRVNNKPLAETPVYEVAGNLLHRERDASFLRKVLAGLPEKSELPVGDFYAGREGAEEVERMYAEAEAERRANA